MNNTEKDDPATGPLENLLTARLNKDGIGTAPDPLEKLLPALLQIFLTMGLGWLAGTMKMFGPKEARGLGLFVGKFSLPALIFISLAELNLAQIRWGFIMGVFFSKSIIFGFVFLLNYFLTRNVSRAAIFAIFSTQTNDFGMGLPILDSIFGSGVVDETRLKGLLFLVAPISLLILNPIGFTLLELEKNKSGQSKGKLEKNKSVQSKGKMATLLSVLRGLLTNPIVAMTILGVLVNRPFGESIRQENGNLYFLKVFSDKLGAAFGALAPFTLGLSTVGKLNAIKAQVIKPVASLVILKTVATPLLFYIITTNTVNLVEPNLDPSNSSKLSNFGLLLGSFPTALGVASYSSDYTDVISPAIILSTVVSVPLIYGVANILTVTSESLENLNDADHSWIDSIISLISCVIIISLFISRKKLLHSTHLLTTVIIFLTFFSSATCLLISYIRQPILPALHLTALHASRLLTVGLAVKLLIRARSSSVLSSPFSNAVLTIICPLTSLFTLPLLLCKYSEAYYAFGLYQDYVSLTFNIICLIPTAICVFLLSRSEHGHLPGVQMFRHSLLLTALTAAMFSSVVVALGRMILLKDSSSGKLWGAGYSIDYEENLIKFKGYPGAFKAIICIDKILSAGQGMIFLFVFGMTMIAQKIGQLHKIVAEYFVWIKDDNFSSIASNFVMVDKDTKAEEKVMEMKMEDQICKNNNNNNCTAICSDTVGFCH